jgi:hypothetical protein
MGKNQDPGSEIFLTLHLGSGLIRIRIKMETITERMFIPPLVQACSYSED